MTTLALVSPTTPPTAPPTAPSHRTQRPVRAARRLTSDAHAVAVAHEVARDIARNAAERDRQRILPTTELELVSAAGLWAMNVPKAHGGAGVSYATVAQVFAILSAADASIGQIQQNHNSAVFWLDKTGTEAQRDFFLGEILRGCRFGNANVDIGGRHAPQRVTTIRRSGQGFVVDGHKIYSTGAFFAHYVTVIGANEAGEKTVAIIPAGTPGLRIVDDWDSFGQRTTASGTVHLDQVQLPEICVLPIHRSYSEQAQAAVSQISHVGIDLGIAQAALDDAVAFLREHASIRNRQPGERAVSDPHVIAQVGDLQIRIQAAEAMALRAGRAIDAAIATPDDEHVAQASLAVAAAKVLTTEVALQTSSKLFELGGAGSSQAPHAFDRHWRNARVHTLHDPVRSKFTMVGDHLLNGVPPERAGRA